jgi:cell division septum initiation protein DivIVA
MSEIANARINTFGKSPKADFVSSSEQLITLTIGQLSDLITQAVEKAIQPLQDEVESFRATITSLDTKVSALESTQDTHAENSFIQLRLINELRETAKKKPGKITANQENRIKILRALLAAHNGKMLTKEARQIMKMDKGAFSRLVDAMPEYIETKPYSLNKRQTILVLKSRSIVDDNDQRLS